MPRTNRLYWRSPRASRSLPIILAWRNKRAWEVLERWTKPFLTAFSDADPATKAWEPIFQARIPGAKGQPHTEIKGAGHFVQEEAGEELGRILAGLMASL